MDKIAKKFGGLKNFLYLCGGVVLRCVIMQKEKTVRTYQRRTKSGKTVTVHQHKAKYDAAEELRKAAKKKGAGSELESKQRETPAKQEGLGFTADEYKEWYNWDIENDPKNKAALKVKAALQASMGKSGYRKYESDMTDSWSARGCNKAFKSLSETKSTQSATPKSSRKSTETGKHGISVADYESAISDRRNTMQTATYDDRAIQKARALFESRNEKKGLKVKTKDGKTAITTKQREILDIMKRDGVSLREATMRSNKEAKRKRVEFLVKNENFRRIMSENPFSTRHRKQMGVPSDKEINDARKKAHDSLLSKGYVRHSLPGVGTFYFKGKEGSHQGIYRVIDKIGRSIQVGGPRLESLKRTMAKRNGKTYKARPYLLYR